MEVYKAPESDLLRSDDIEIKPIKSILVGLTLTIIVVSIVSSIIMIVAALLLGLDITNDEVMQQLTEETGLLLVDVIISFGLLFLSGYYAAKYVPTKEIKYGVILATLTLAIYIVLFILSDTFSLFPLWYNLLSLLIVVLAIVFGAKLRASTFKNK